MFTVGERVSFDYRANRTMVNSDDSLEKGSEVKSRKICGTVIQVGETSQNGKFIRLSFGNSFRCFSFRGIVPGTIKRG